MNAPHPQDRVGRPAEGRQLGIVDPECRVIALHLYAGLLKVVPLELDSGQEMKAFNIRLDDLYAVDLKFLHGFDLPTISYLVEVREHIAIYALSCDSCVMCFWFMYIQYIH